MKLIRMLARVLAMALLTASTLAFARHEQDLPIQYDVGTMNGVKLSMPSNYIQGAVIYAAKDGQRGGPASEATTQDSKIDNFGILLKLSDLQPMKTYRDRDDWNHALATSRPSFESSWMMVAFDNHYPLQTYWPNNAPNLLPWGPYDQDQELRFGLEHFESVKSVDEDALHGHVEYFYSPSSHTTILCQTRRRKVEPFDTFDTCHHYFVVPELNVTAEAFYTKKDLPRWHEFEDRAREIAHSFVVP